METKKSQKASLENKRMMFVEIGCVLSLVAVLMAFESKSATGRTNDIVCPEALNLEEDDVIPITLETPPEMPKVAIPVFETIEIVDNEVTVDDIFIDTEDSADKGVDIKDYEAEVVEEHFEEEEIPFFIAEDKPTFMGGDANNFTKWVMSNIEYPESCRNNGVYGKVILMFTVDKTGKLGNIKVVREIDPALAKEAVRVVSMSPRWEPGKMRGRAVNVTYTFPVQFMLQ